MRADAAKLTLVVDQGTGASPLCPEQRHGRVAKSVTREVGLARLDSYAEEIHARTGLRPSAYCGASKLSWLMEHEPAVKDAAAIFGPLARISHHPPAAARGEKCGLDNSSLAACFEASCAAMESYAT